MTKAGLTVEASDDVLTQIFNQIDEDGSESIERAELVNFLRHADFNLTAVAAVSTSQSSGLRRKKTMREHNEERKNEPSETSNQTTVEKVRDALGPFNYEPTPVQAEKNRQIKPMTLETGAKYEGQVD